MRITKYIPNAITSMNLACGAAGVVCVGLGHTDIAFLLMLCGALADFCDGLVARLVGAWSLMGKELDSLADVVSFGLLPSVMMVKMMMGSYGTDCIAAWIPLVIAVFSGLRLAKFNVDERQTSSFIGMPTPACAMICGSLTYFLCKCPESAFTQAVLGNIWVIPSISVVLSLLLVCEIPMFSMKFHKGEKWDFTMNLRIAFAGAVVASTAMVIVAQLNWSMIAFTSFSAYIIINIIGAIFVRNNQKKQ